MKRVAVCSGSFDPVTYGHIDIFKRACNMFDELVVCVFYNPTKPAGMFNVEERVKMLKQATKHLSNVRVTSYAGLLNEFCAKEGIRFVVRGLRAFSDFEYEFQRALMLKSIDHDLETVFIMTNPQYSYVSSSGVRELAVFGGKVDDMVPACVARTVKAKFEEVKNG